MARGWADQAETPKKMKTRKTSRIASAPTTYVGGGEGEWWGGCMGVSSRGASWGVGTFHCWPIQTLGALNVFVSFWANEATFAPVWT
jgi:hypothetical protein